MEIPSDLRLFDSRTGPCPPFGFLLGLSTPSPLSTSLPYFSFLLTGHLPVPLLADCAAVIALFESAPGFTCCVILVHPLPPNGGARKC